MKSIFVLCIAALFCSSCNNDSNHSKDERRNDPPIEEPSTKTDVAPVPVKAADVDSVLPGGVHICGTTQSRCVNNGGIPYLVNIVKFADGVDTFYIASSPSGITMVKK